ncbi:MAG: hypothetical protein ACR2QF_04570, partial [Geminicoccaceae bacterium]
GRLAIVSIDLAGYSRLMEEDEQGTHRALMSCRRDILEPIVSSYNGHIIKSTGDGALVTFLTAKDAIEAMIAFRERVTSRKATFPKRRCLVFRTGIHIAEAIYDDGDLYGHGVNLAVRLQEAAEPGSIYLSEAVVGELPDEIVIGLANLGQRTFKNLSRPVSLFRWPISAKEHRKNASLQLATLAATALIVVSTPTEPENIQVRDGIDKRQNTQVAGTAEQGQRQAHLPVDGPRDDPGARGMDEVVANTLWNRTSLKISSPASHVTEAQIARRIAPNTVTSAKVNWRGLHHQNDPAEDSYIRAWLHYTRNSPQGLRWAVNDLSMAVEMDPTHSHAHALLAACYWTIWQNHWQKDLRLTASEVLRLTQKHLDAVDEPVALAHVVASEMLTANGRHHDAIAEAERAISTDPAAASGYYAKGLALIFDGQPTEGEKLILKAVDKNPYLPRFLFGLALAQFNADRFDDALSTLSLATARDAENDWLFFLLAATYGQLGQTEKAATALRRFKELGSRRRGWVENYLPYLHTWPFREERDRQRMRHGLLKADDSAPFRLAIR